MDDAARGDIEAVIELRIPADTAFARLARLTAARLARRHGLTYREVEDLRLAVDEAMVALLATDTPASDLEIRYSVGTDRIQIDFNGVQAATDEQADRFDTIVADLVDDRSLDRTGHNIRLVKQHHPDPDEAETAGGETGDAGADDGVSPAPTAAVPGLTGI